MVYQLEGKVPTAEEKSLMYALARTMAGGFSNQKQSFADSKNYAHIRVYFRPLPWEFFNGIGFYSEQVYDYDLWLPYRQGIHRFVPYGDEVYIENYSLKDALLYAGAGRNLDILRSIKPDVIERRCNCSMIFRPEDNGFQGRVEGKCCVIEKRGKKTYLVSDARFTETSFTGWDRGLDVETDEQVWGSAVGPLKFEKTENYAAEVVENY